MKAHPETGKEFIKNTLRTLTAGYFEITGVRCVLFVGELLELFPDATVICTTREAESWVRSCCGCAKSASDYIAPPTLLAIINGGGIQRLDRGNIFPASIYSYLVETKILLNFRLQQCAGSYQKALSDMELIVLHGDIILSGI